MNSATQNPLSDDELLELAEFLVSEAVPETAMDIETLDGFLCALAVGPESVTLGEALPNVWSDDPGVGAAPVHSTTWSQRMARPASVITAYLPRSRTTTTPPPATRDAAVRER